MGKTKYVVLVIMLVNLVIAGDNELACCPPYTLVIAQEEDKCWDPLNNTESATRLECNMTINVYDFTVNDGLVMLELPLQRHDANSSTVCIGNSTTHTDHTKVRPIALLCYDDKLIEQAFRGYYIEEEILAYCMNLSVLFLILTAVVYSSFKELRDLFGKSIINFCIALGLGLFLISVMKFVAYGGEHLCAFRGFSAYYFLLAAFFWSNSISIQVMIETRFPNLTDFSWRRYRWFMLYSWGVPALLTMLAAAVNYVPGEHESPGIGYKICWFSTLEQQWYYMYSVMTILILINIAIFVMTLRMVWRQTFLSNHLRTVKFKISITIRLFVVMGLSWIFEMISSSLNTHIIWTVISIFNSSQGILLFLILVVFRKKVIKLFHKRGWFCCCSELVGRYLSGDNPEDNIQQTEVPMSDSYPMM